MQEKNINDDLKIIINKIVKIYSINNKTYKINKKDIIIFRIRYFIEIKAFQKYYLYKKQYKNRNNK